MTIDSGFSHLNWWFPIVMLVNQRVLMSTMMIDQWMEWGTLFSARTSLGEEF